MKKQIKLAGALLAILMSATSTINAQWKIEGNSGTTPGTNFVGTKDNKALVFKTNGTSTTGERMRITETGYVGIGTASPASKLQVYGSEAVSLSAHGLFKIASSAANFAQMRFDANRIQSTVTYASGTIGSNLLFNPYGGRVGIGTNSEPSARLFIAADAGERAFQVAINNATKMMIESNGGTSIGYTSGNTPPIDGLIVNGNVGIGYTSPTSKLTVNGDAGSSAFTVKNDGYTNLRVTSNGGVGIGENYPGSTTAVPPDHGLYVAGNVGIGTWTPSYKLEVCGTIRAKEVRVETGWCDYVFADDYPLPSLTEVENYIKANKHLPGVTPGPEIENNGLEVGKVSAQMIKKIEELTLYVIQLDKQNKALKGAIDSLKK